MNDEARHFDLDVVGEKRDAAQIQILKAMNRMVKDCNKNSKNKTFQVRDLVLKKIEVSKHTGKLDPNWERPFKIVKIYKRRTYRLQDMHGKDLP